MSVRKVPRVLRNDDCYAASKGMKGCSRRNQPARLWLTPGAGLVALATFAMMLLACRPAFAWQSALSVLPQLKMECPAVKVATTEG
jgi:hypothetical protein